MNISDLFILGTVVSFVSAQEITTPIPSNSLIPLNSESAIVPIPGFATDSIEKNSVNQDSVKSKDSTLISIDKGFSFGARWSFTSSNVFADWVSQQTTYMNSLSETIRELKYPATVSWLMKPEKQSFSFPVSLGFFHRIDSLRSFSLHSHYSYRKQHSTFVALRDTTRAIVNETDSKIIHHQAEISGELQFRIPPTYFSVSGVNATGFSVLFGIIPLSYFKLETESTIREMRRSGSTFGAGGSWGAGIFTDKQISSQFMTRFYFNYHGNVTYGYDNYNSLFTVAPVAAPSEKEILTEHFFELGFHGIIAKKSPETVTNK